MTFTKNSVMVKVWVGLVLSDVYTLEQVPKLCNLREAVAAVINPIVEE